MEWNGSDLKHFESRVRALHNISPEEQAREFGDQLWKRDPDARCGIRKVDPMARALASGVDCWVAGIRREDSATRGRLAEVHVGQEVQHLEAEPDRRLVRNAMSGPYLHKHGIPYNPLQRSGLVPRSVAPIAPVPFCSGQSSRDGRWSGSARRSVASTSCCRTAFAAHNG